MSDNATIKLSPTKATIKNGYDLPIFGLDSGQLLVIHLPALTCICLSLLSAITVLIVSFKTKSYKTFFTWSKSERFVVYLAICDGMFSITHSMDHLHILITKDHPPNILCEFHSFIMVEFLTAQNLMVNVVSINAFVLVFFRKKIDFGRFDYRLLLWTFGVPFVADTIALFLGTMGPNGVFCLFDGVNGAISNLLFMTIPTATIFIMNVILYFLTWLRIRQEEPSFRNSTLTSTETVRMSHRAAKRMSLFVAAFFIQWWAYASYGIVQNVSKSPIPFALFQLVTTFTNIGGVLNGIVYIIIRRRANLSLVNSSSGPTTSSQGIVLPNKSVDPGYEENDPIETAHATT